MAKATLELQVEGMSCEACVRSIQRKLSRVAGVESSRVDLETGKARVDYDDTKAGPDQLIGAIEQIGYHASRT